MEEKRYFEGGWREDSSFDAIKHIRAGYYTLGEWLPDEAYDVVIGRRDIHTLIEFLDREGYIKPRLDTRLREEDLKITHRLLDLLDKR